MNPFELNIESTGVKFLDWNNIYPKPYDKETTNPYTKTRVILMNGTETEQVFFLHQFHRNCNNNNLRREIALLRRIEQQQQKKIQCLKPINESILETTIMYELLAVDLTSRLAQNEPDINVKNALDFALLEDFDHLYRYANLLKMEYGTPAEKLVGKYAEITPGRPTISEHRYPFDSVRRYINNKTADPITKLNASIITAAEQQTMNFYMNVCNLYESDIGRQLYQEIGMIEEQHVTQYGSLIDPNVTWLENLLLHMYTACYLYYSCFQDETDENVKKVWDECFKQEVENLHKAACLLKDYQNKEWKEVIPNGTFPKLLSLGPNIEYVRGVLGSTVYNTALKEDYIAVNELPKNSDFEKYQHAVNHDVNSVPSHKVVDKYIQKNNTDYRFETDLNPVPELRDRSVDNTTVGRKI
jgi:hypothetical protein